MDGTYGNVYQGRTASPMMPGTPTAYQTNINRTKTRKWVEAKAQNYDGDDWGDDYDDEEPEEEPPPPSKPTGLRQPGQGATESTPVTSPYGQTPTPHTAGPRAMPMPSHVRKTSTGSRTPSGAPPLHVQTQQHQANFLNEQHYSSGSGGTSGLPSSMANASNRFATEQPFTQQPGVPRQNPPSATYSGRPEQAGPVMSPSAQTRGRASSSTQAPGTTASSRRAWTVTTGGAMRSPTGERRRASFERDDPASDASRGLKTTLAPVAERMSEYGMDRLMSNSNNDTPDTSRAPNPTDGAKGNYISEEQSRLNKLELQSSRRLSVSPQLPDLTRMSGFGEDFFGGSHSQPQYFAEDPEPMTGPRGPSATETFASDPPHRGPSLIEGPALAASRGSKDPATQPGLTLPTEANSAGSSGGLGATHNQMTSGASRAPRPSIPGGWVSETTNFGSETPTPMKNTDLPTRQLSPPQEEVSPVTETGVDDLVPTTAVKQAQPLDTTPKMASQHDGFGGATGKHDQDVANEVAPSGPASHATPLSLPPLQTSAPEASSGSQRENISNSPSTTSQAEPSPSHFIPTAPLNPRRIDTPEGPIVVGIPPRNLTMSSIETASPNENDRLRDDIMKSLNASPIHAGGAGGLLGPSSGSLDGAALTRESTYLSGPVAISIVIPNERGTLHLNTPNQPQPTFKRRFSWEGGPEEVSVSPTTGTNAPFIGADTSQDPAKSSTSSQSAPTATVEPSTAPTPAVHIDTENGGAMSHQVSLVSSRGPEGLGIAGLEPPSPVSILSNRKSLASPGMDNSKRLSLADEKSLMEEASQPPSPPHAQHPALSPAPAAEDPMEDARVPQAAPGPTSLNQPKIMAWREILSLPTLPMRAEKFEEARVQYAEMDSGLSNWLLHMQGQANGVNAAGYEMDLPAGMSGPGQSPTSAGAQASAQQPYYQQYLNASNPNLASAPQPGLGRQSTGNMLQSQQSSSGFGAPHNQVGTKSKELLQAAAGFANKGTRTGIKSGMKLFNKGKSKFRGGTGSGDKVFQ
ncbi:hypothetical protein PG994_004950 [Apiospora phragmitis]|uniref:Uncharacterized protein n=1 Tax=Apiospora phragmitis TaxID=2905665 RepID=A0ABR1VS29_9PEZI